MASVGAARRKRHSMSALSAPVVGVKPASASEALAASACCSQPIAQQPAIAAESSDGSAQSGDASSSSARRTSAAYSSRRRSDSSVSKPARKSGRSVCTSEALIALQRERRSRATSHTARAECGRCEFSASSISAASASCLSRCDACMRRIALASLRAFSTDSGLATSSTGSVRCALRGLSSRTATAAASAAASRAALGLEVPMTPRPVFGAEASTLRASRGSSHRIRSIAWVSSGTTPSAIWSVPARSSPLAGCRPATACTERKGLREKYVLGRVELTGRT
eukprot:4026450-Pleurochrysis_carterae.AAC.2